MGIVALFIVCCYIWSGINSERLLKYAKYTDATVVSEWHHKNNTGIGVDYEYKVSGRKHEFTINLDLKKNGKYLLAYDSLKPGNGQILEMYPLPENIRAPENGWHLNELPFKADRQEILGYIKDNK